MALQVTAHLSQPISMGKRARADTANRTTVVLFCADLKPLNCQENAIDLFLKARKASLNFLEADVGTDGWG